MPALGSYIITQTVPFNSSLTLGQFNFAVANLDPAGSVPDTLEEIQEELTDTGVNGRRYRRIQKQFSKFGLATIADASDYASGLSLARNYRIASGCYGNLTITLDGIVYQWNKVKCLGCVPEVRKGILVGNGASGTSAVIVYAKWQFVLTDTSKNGASV